MQAQPDYLSVPRRELDVEDYIDIVRRHWMWIVGPVYAALVIAVAVAFLWPDTFISSAVMRITPPQVSVQLVPQNYSQQIAERLETMRQDVTSRSKLIDMIKKFNLYPREQSRKPLEDVVEDMRRKVDIRTVEVGGAGGPRVSSAFRIAFSYENRIEAQKVVAEIVSAFTSQNAIDTRQKNRITTDLLSDVLKTAKAELDRIEGDLTGFRVRNAGSLPEELGANLQTQRSYEVQLQSIQDALHRGQQDKMMLETQVQNMRAQAKNLQVAETESSYTRNERLIELERGIARLEGEMASLRERLKPDHPDIRAGLAQIETWKTERDRLAQLDEKTREGAVRRVTNPNAQARQLELDGQIKQIQARINAINLDMEERIKQEKIATEALRRTNARILTNPVMQGEYAKMMRDYNLAKANYDDLKSRQTRAEVSQTVIERSAGENLEVLDPANLPLTPSEPNRFLIIAAGVGIGMIVGLFLAGARELKDTTIKGLKDVRAYTNMAILSSIPLLENALLVRRKRRLAWLAWSSAMIVGVVAMSSSVYYYYWGHN